MTTSVRSAVVRHRHDRLISFCRSFIVLSTIRCSKSVQKSAFRTCQVATVIMSYHAAGSKSV